VNEGELHHRSKEEKAMKKSFMSTTALALGLCVILSGCVWLRSSAISDRSGGGQSASAEVGDWGLLHLTSPDNLTETASSQLVSKCPGKLTNVQTELYMREWVLIQWYTVSATAVCL
jgi:hypothetical protein